MNIKSLLFAGTLAAMTFSISASAAIAPAENLLPADTLGFFTVPDTAVFRTASKTSPQLRFWNDPAMKPFHDKFMAKLNEKYITPLEKDLGVKVADFLDLPQGQLTLAITVNGSNGRDEVPPGILLLLDAKDKSGLLKTNLAVLQKKWSDAGRVMRTEKFHGLSFTVVSLSSNDIPGIFPKRAPVQELGVEPKPEKPVEIYFTQYESLLVAGNSPKVVEPVAAHLTGGNTPAIATDAAFAADKLSELRDAPTYYAWFNAAKFFALISQTPDEPANLETGMPRPSVGKILTAIGLDKLKSASFTLRDSPDGANFNLHLTVPEASRAGLLKIISISGKDAGVPAFVPADAVKFSRFRLDGKQTWAELQKMVGAMSPPGLAGINSVIDMANSFAQQKNPGFDLRTSLFANLGDDVISYQKAPVGDSFAALSHPPTLFLIAVSNPDETIDAIKTLAMMAAKQEDAKPRDFLGKKIHTITMRAGVNPSTRQPVPAPPLFVSASGGYMALSADASILEEYLRSADKPPKPLRETSGLMEAAQRAGGTGGGIFGYQNQRETMRESFKLLKNAAEADVALKMFPETVREWVDFSLLPDYAAVQKYFYMSVFTGSANAAGFSWKVFTPSPPQL